MPTKVGTYQGAVDSMHTDTPVPTKVGIYQNTVDSRHTDAPAPTRVGSYLAVAGANCSRVQTP